jgi:hypothetical protein
MDETAFDIIKKTLMYYGLKDADFLTEVETLFKNKVISDRSTVDDIGVAMQASPAFARRFPANKILADRGKAQYSVSQYLTMEADFKSRLQAAGMPANFYDSAEDFQMMIANDVSPNELSARIEMGYQAVRNAPRQVVEQFKTLYGVSEGDLAAYFIDPEAARPTFDKYQAEREARSALIASQASTQAGIQLDRAAAEELARAGVQGADAQQNFAAISEQQGLFATTTAEAEAGKQNITQQEQIAGTFGTNAEARKKIAQRKRERQAAFETGGSLLTTQQGNIGLGTVG